MRTTIKIAWQLRGVEYTATLHASWKEFGMRLVTILFQQNEKTSPVCRRQRRSTSFQTKWRRLSDRFRPVNAKSDPITGDLEPVSSPPRSPAKSRMLEIPLEQRPQPLTFHHSLGGQDEGPIHLPRPRRSSFTTAASHLNFLRSEKAARHVAAAKYSLQNANSQWETVITQVHDKLRLTASFNFFNSLGRKQSPPFSLAILPTHFRDRFITCKILRLLE